MLWSRTGLGGPEARCPLNGSQTRGWEAALCPHLMAHTAVHTVPAPGPRVAHGPFEHRRCGGPCRRASRHAGHQKTNILFLRCAFRPAHPQDGTCETTSLSAWRAENSLLNKSRGTVPKHTKVWREAKADALPRCTGDAPMRGRLLRRPGLPGACPEGVRAQADRPAERWGPHGSSPTAPRFCYRCWLPEKGGPFCKNEEIANQFINLVSQMDRLRPREEVRLGPDCTAGAQETRLLTLGPCPGEAGQGWDGIPAPGCPLGTNRETSEPQFPMCTMRLIKAPKSQNCLED